MQGIDELDHHILNIFAGVSSKKASEETGISSEPELIVHLQSLADSTCEHSNLPDAVSTSDLPSRSQSPTIATPSMGMNTLLSKNEAWEHRVKGNLHSIQFVVVGVGKENGSN